MKPEVADGSFLEQHLITKPKPSETFRLKRYLQNNSLAQNSTAESVSSNLNNSIVFTTTEKGIFGKQKTHNYF